jgi:hypothetical protein
VKDLSIHTIKHLQVAQGSSEPHSHYMALALTQKSWGGGQWSVLSSTQGSLEPDSPNSTRSPGMFYFWSIMGHWAPWPGDGNTRFLPLDPHPCPNTFLLTTGSCGLMIRWGGSLFSRHLFLFNPHLTYEMTIITICSGITV